MGSGDLQQIDDRNSIFNFLPSAEPAVSSQQSHISLISTHLRVGELRGLEGGHVAAQPELLHLKSLQVLLPLADLALNSKMDF